MLLKDSLRAVAVWTFALCAPLSFANQGITDTTITIGMSSPFTGPTGQYGVEMRRAIVDYFDHINASGGVHNRKLKLISIDDGYEAERTVANTKKLIEEDKVFALVGYYGTSPTTSAMNVFSAAKVPLIGTVSGASNLREPVNRYMFHVRASYKDETHAVVEHLLSLGIKEIGVFYQNDGFGKSGLEGITAALKKHNLAPHAVATIERNSLDVASAIQTMKQARPQAVIMVTLYKPTAEFVRQMQKAAILPQFVALSPVGANLLVDELGAAARGIGISQVMPHPSNNTIPLNKEYKQIALQKNKDYIPSYYAIEGFLNAKVLVEGIKRAGKDLTAEKLVNALEEMRRVDFGGFRINYSPTNHNGSDFIELTVIGAGGHIVR